MGIPSPTLHTGPARIRTNIDIDDTLMAQAQSASGLPTKKATVDEGLRLLIRLRGQEAPLTLAGTVRRTGDPDASRRRNTG